MVRWPLLWLGLGGFVACASPAVVAPRAPAAGSRAWRTQATPIVTGPRLVPETLDPSMAYGADPAGGARFMAEGLRLLREPGGATQVSEARFGRSPRVVALPPRLGGGALFALDRTLWQSDSWLGAPRPIYTSPYEIADVSIGLDRVYVRAPGGAYVAVDARTGDEMDLGPWPSTPSVVAYRALDGWSAVAIADLRGAVASFDAGATWRALGLPVDADRVGSARADAATGRLFEVPPGSATPGDLLFVHGDDVSGACFSVSARSPPAKLAACPAPETVPERSSAPSEASAMKTSGPPAWLAAIEDGWPLDDGSAIVARDGALGRVRLSDGAWIAVTPEAFPARTARCHPAPLLLDEGAPVLGFACASAPGTTRIYAYDPSRSALSLARAFDGGRAVLAFGNGAIAVRGACEAGASSSGGSYCVLSRGPANLSAAGAPSWRAVSNPTADADARLLVGSDGRAAFLSPPHGSLDGARIAFVDPRGDGVPLVFPDVPAAAARALTTGVWLDGWEERAPGVFGGWVESAGTMLGVEVELGGHVRVGAFVRDAGSPIVSGRFGLGWSASRRGYQTTDGGMTWTSMEVPEPLSRPRARACGPVGCTAAGWLRVGWGAPAPSLVAPSVARAGYRTLRDVELDLVCDAAEPAPPSIARASGGGGGFFGLPGPTLSGEDQSVTVDASTLLDRAARTGPLARVTAWGPRGGDWSHVGRWQAQWLSPFGGPFDAHTSSSTLAPFPTIDAARADLLGDGALGLGWSMTAADDLTAAILLKRRGGMGRDVAQILTLEADRPVVEVRRADGEPFESVESAVKSGDRWYLLTASGRGEPRAAVVYRVDGSEARELARVPRAGVVSRAIPAPRLARRSDGSALGVVVVEGQPSPGAIRWLVPIDRESGVVGAPQPLGSIESDGPPRACADEPAWVLDTTWSGLSWSAKARVEVAGGRAFQLKNLYVRARLSIDHACLETVSGSFEPWSGEARRERRPDAAPKVGPNDPGTIAVAVSEGRGRYRLRCHPR